MKNQISILILLFVGSMQIMAQNATVKGVITDATNNEPLPFAYIVVEGTQIGTTSDLDGNFTITGLEPGFIQLKGSYLGYDTKLSEDILLSNTNIPFIELKLETASELLTEVVISVDPFEKKQEAPISMQTI